MNRTQKNRNALATSKEIKEKQLLKLTHQHSVWVTDAGVVTGLGDTPDDLWESLLSKKTAIRPVQRFSADNYHSGVASCISGLSASGRASMIHDLLDRLLPDKGRIPADAHLITATTKAGIDYLERSHQGEAADARDLLLSSFPDAVSRKLGLADTGVNVSAACASSAIAVARGAARIASGQAEAVLICCADLVTEFVFSGFSCLRAMSSAPCQPFDRNRSGLSLGEGGAFLLLMSEDRARQERHPHLGTILGWGAANDAAHITAPARDGCGLVQAIRQALAVADADAEAVSAISAHGTGTVYNDLMELTAFHQVFGDTRIPTHSVKGAIGHTLAAAGGIEVVLGLRMLAEQLVPPTVGFSEPEASAAGWVRSEAADFSGDCLLTTNSGFGGINAAILLGKGGAA